MSGGTTLLEVENLTKTFALRHGLFGRVLPVHAVSDVSFTLATGETLGVVGESGCGKSTLGRTILRLIEPSSGRVVLAGQSLTDLDTEALRARRRDMQIIFQDPIASLDPRMTVGDIIAEPLTTYEPQLTRGERQARVLDMMERVGLQPEMINRYPHEFSGGQAQRIGIARAIVQNPRLVICDEPVSALDVSIRAQIINLLAELKATLDLTLMFISHDLSVVRHISDRILVLYLGRVIEVGPTDAVFERPSHPYTAALLSSVLVPDPEVARHREATPLTGEVPSPINPPSGCAFRSRCPFAIDRCAAERPELRPYDGRDVACHRVEEITDRLDPSGGQDTTTFGLG
ncbi:MAG: dipeptide ABC transporter ATP-binding protein [Hyphomicrobiales bacterium]|nr:dipeptide ABC transporter ATP-binding protein [Hyphomicrobiales bacterium]